MIMSGEGLGNGLGVSLHVPQSEWDQTVLAEWQRTDPGGLVTLAFGIGQIKTMLGNLLMWRDNKQVGNATADTKTAW